MRSNAAEMNGGLCKKKGDDAPLKVNMFLFFCQPFHYHTLTFTI